MLPIHSETTRAYSREARPPPLWWLGRARLPTHVTKRTYWEGINPWTRTESQTTSILKAVTLLSQFRNSASAKLRQVLRRLCGDE
jgi:hypothetical protein